MTSAMVIRLEATGFGRNGLVAVAEAAGTSGMSSHLDIVTSPSDKRLPSTVVDHNGAGCVRRLLPLLQPFFVPLSFVEHLSCILSPCCDRQTQAQPLNFPGSLDG